MEKRQTLQLVRNATLKLNYAGKSILVDPVLADKGTLMSALGVNLNPRVHLPVPADKVTEGVDMVLLTHNHIDHYEPGVKRYLPADVPFYVQPADKESIEKDGFTNVRVVDDTCAQGSLRIYRVEGHHGRGPLGEMMGVSSGFVLEAAECPTLYIMGDCLWDDDTSKAVTRFSPDYIVVNCGGAIFPELSKQYGAAIMNEQDVVKMMADCPSSVRLIAVHMDAIDHCQTTRSILRNEARYYGVEGGRLIIPEDGETVVLD